MLIHIQHHLIGLVTYYVITELFGSSSSTKVFSESLEKIRANPEVYAPFIMSILCYTDS